MKVISSPPIQQKLDALIKEAEDAGCVVEKIELSTREFDALLAAGKLTWIPPEPVAGVCVLNRIGRFMGFLVFEERL